MRMAEAELGELLIDLGSGDGTVLIIASSRLKMRSLGFEADSRLYEEAKRRVVEEGLAEVHLADFMDADLSEADMVYAYLPTNAEQW